MLINLVIWQKVLLLNNSIKYLIILLFTIQLFGQRRNIDNSQNYYTFKKAVKQYNTGNFQDADEILGKISPSEKEYFEQEISLLSMRVKYRLDDLQSSKEIGKILLVDHPNGEYSTDVLLTLGDIFIAEGLYDAAFRTYIKSYKNNDNKNYKKNIVKRIFLSLQMGISPSIPEELLSIEIDKDLIQILLLAKVQTELQNGHSLKAANSLAQLNGQDMLKINRDYYSELGDKINSKTKGRKFIGVVLPLTGKDTKIGMEFLDGLKYAEEINFSNNIELSLIVYDNAGDALNTLKAFRTLNNNPNISATIGPISTDNSVIAASFAETSGVPLILPTTTINGLSDVSDNIFLMNSDLTTRGNQTGEFIAETLQAENIAVIASADKFGKSLVDAFTDKLNSFNITPQIVEWYSGIPLNLERQFKSIREKAWELSDSTGVTDSLDIIETTIDSLFLEEEQMTADDSAKVVLSSIDAIYMPIHEGHVDFVGAQYPAYNLDAVVIGNDNWTDMDVLRKEIIGPHFEGMFVISNYNDYQIESLNSNFNEKHSRYFYQAIDCYNLLVESLTKANASNIPITQILSNLDSFDGLFGNYNFSNSNVNSLLKIIQFDGYDFEKYIDPNQYFQY